MRFNFNELVKLLFLDSYRLKDFKFVLQVKAIIINQTKMFNNNDILFPVNTRTICAVD